jgi:hypothetical protein
MQRYDALRMEKATGCIKVSWKQDNPRTPNLLYSELDDEHWSMSRPARC